MNFKTKEFIRRISNVKTIDDFEYTFSLMYVSYLSKRLLSTNNLVFNYHEVIKKEEDKEIKKFLDKTLSNVNFEDVNFFFNIDEDVLSIYALKYPENINTNFDYSFTNNSIINLSNKLLKIDKGEVVGDFCSGMGSFLNSTAIDFPNNNYIGYEINSNNLIIAKMKTNLNNIILKDNKKLNINFYEHDVLLDPVDVKFDKIFMEVPFNLRPQDEKYLDKLNSRTPLFASLNLASSLDWAFITILMSSLKDDGVGIALAHPSTFSSLNSLSFRKHFIDNGYIEAVISLPSGLLNTTLIGPVIYKLSHNNKSVKFIDAKHIYSEERRRKTYDLSDIEKIINLLDQENDYAVNVSNKEIINNNYRLNPNQYLVKFEYEKSAQLGDLTNIKRGFMLTANQLDNYTSLDETNIKYIKTSDINDGIISNNMESLKDDINELYNYLVKNNNILLSRSGIPFKVAIYQKDEFDVFAQGNLFILEVNEKLIYPPYLQAFLHSDEGQKALKHIATDGIYSLLTINKLKEVLIPMYEYEKQVKIGNKYLLNIERIKEIEHQKKQVILNIGNQFDKN
ncbi:MAG TPA: N-6 DNA methylase [Acholeplasmataceae bacterium]|nr:N-6 DNA methylase [Acholeplasmataceae bacterium]